MGKTQFLNSAEQMMTDYVITVLLQRDMVV